MSNQYRIVIFDKFCPELKIKWDDFRQVSFNTPFQSFSLLVLWYNTIATKYYNISPCIVLIYYDDSLLAIFPLCIIKYTFRINVLEWLGGHQADYMAPLISNVWHDNTHDINIIWEKVINKIPDFDVIHLQKQPEYINDVYNPMIQIMDNVKYTSSYSSTLESDWEYYKKNRIKKRILSDSNRQIRRLSEIGEIKFEVITDEIKKNNLIDNMITQKRRRYRETSKWDMFSLEGYREFYHKCLQLKDDQIEIHCSALLVNGTMIATHFGLVSKGTFYYLMPSYEGNEWIKYSSGRILLIKLLEWSINNKLSSFDFTIGGENYKSYWCNKELSMFEQLENKTYLGMFYLFITRLKHSINKNERIKNLINKFRNIILDIN